MKPIISVLAVFHHIVSTRETCSCPSWARRILVVAALALVMPSNVPAAIMGKVTGWGAQVVFPPDGYGATFTRVATGGFHNMALKTDGTVVAWGDNQNGQSIVPAGLTGVVAISGGWTHSLALKEDGTVVDWGQHSVFQNTVLSGLSNVVAIAAGGRHSLAVKEDGTVVSWGQFYFGNYGASTVPSGLRGVVAIAAGASHSLAVKGDGTVVAWGNNENGQCSVPNGLSGVVAIAASQYYSVALFDADTANRPPIPASYSVDTWRDLPLTIDLLKLLRAGSDPDSDVRVVTAVSAASMAGGAVVLSSNGITYTPPSGYTGADTFTYTVTDARTASAQGTVTVKIIGSADKGPNFQGITAVSDTVTVRLLGAPGHSYQFEASTNLVNWVNVGQATAGSNRLFEFTDRDKGIYPYRYYRAVK